MIANTEYYPAYMIGTTRHMTNSSGSETGTAVYTAFGERMSGSIGGPGDRYGYAGSSGYQAAENFPIIHVGHRYYDPAIGRFVQRDPIGIRGGLNVYAYVKARLIRTVDACGLGAGAAARWGALGVCGWVVLEITERIIVPAIDDWADKNYKEGMDDLNNPAPPSPPPPAGDADDDGDEDNEGCVGPFG